MSRSHQLIERIRVAVGVIQNDDGDFLITQRPWDASHGPGLWEFPGGKAESGESVSDALVRELYEELGITVHSHQPILSLDHDYPERHVALHFFRVLSFSGRARAKEAQLDLKWVTLDQLPCYSFPKANEVLVSHLQKQALSLAEKKQS